MNLKNEYWDNMVKTIKATKGRIKKGVKRIKSKIRAKKKINSAVDILVREISKNV